MATARWTFAMTLAATILPLCGACAASPGPDLHGVDQPPQDILHAAHDSVEVEHGEHARFATAERHELTAQSHGLRRRSLQ